MSWDPAGVTVDIGEVPTILQAGDETRAAVLLRHLGGAPRDARLARAVVRYTIDGPPCPGRAPDMTIEDIELWHDGAALRLRHLTGVTGVVTAEEAWIGGETDDPGPPFHRMLLIVLGHLLAHHQRYVLHAAAMVPDRAAVVVLGETGQGKSTAALAGLHVGWPVLGDDMLVARLAAAGPEVAGIARPGALPADVSSTFGGPRLEGDPRGRRELAASAFARGWFPVGAVVQSGHGRAAAGELAELEARLALYAVISAFAAAVTPRFLREFLALAAALSRGPTFRLGLGADPAVRLEDAARLLARARR